MGCGTIFSVDPASGQSTVLYAFTGSNGDGIGPGGLAVSGDLLYGVTSRGGSGACACGTVFSFDATTKAERVLYSFAGGSDGQTPVGPPVVSSGILWGTTELGGASGLGTIWQFDSATGAENVAYSFGTNTNDGLEPLAGLLQLDNVLYGTTFTGGSNYEGAVFSFVPSTGVETTLASFGNSTGVGNPGPLESEAALVAFKDSLIGTSTYGGSSGLGTVFSVSLKTGAVTTLWNFTGGADGGVPAAPLLKDGNVLYGVTGRYGANGVGTVFEITP